MNDNTDSYFLLINKKLLDCVYFTDNTFSFEYHTTYYSIHSPLFSSTEILKHIVE
jgi:hypothetical protein